MDLLQKIDLLGEAAQYDICRGCGTHSNRSRDDLGRWIYPAVHPDGKRIAMLKVLQSNVCEKDCAYCANRSGRDVPRATFGPDDLARAFDQLVRAGRVQGLFLSYAFPGYIHLKILPGADDASIEAAVRMAHRVSVNLEAPNARRIRALSQSKDLQRDLLAPLRRAHHIRRQLGSAVSMTTQFVVGAADELDQEILSSSAALYEQLKLARVYYSAFQPIAHTPLEDHAPTPAWREHRLYEADFLLRQYGFGLDELVFEEGNLPRRADPKTLWAWRHPELFPLEINTASREELLRVPGIGPKSAERLVAWRRQGKVRELRQLALAGASAQRASAFVLLDGQRPTCQLPLWRGC